MKLIDLTGHIPIIGGKKDWWIFECDMCRYQAKFRLYKGQGLSTACEICGGDMTRKEIANESISEEKG